MNALHRLILVELHQSDELPAIREVTQPHFIGLAVADTYQSGRRLPLSVAEAMDDQNQHNPRRWAFHSLDEAEHWAVTYDGQQAEAVRFMLSDYHAEAFAEAV